VVAPSSPAPDARDALTFVRRAFEHFQINNTITDKQLAAIVALLDGPEFVLEGLPAVVPGESAAAQSLRYLLALRWTVDHCLKSGLLNLARAHALITEVSERIAVVERKLRPDELIAEVIPVAETADPSGTTSNSAQASPPPAPKRPSVPTRNIVEILLDPRSIQWLLAFGGGLMVFGLVILLWVNEFFTPPITASVLAGGNLALLFGGWFVLGRTRYQMAGRALTLLACLVLPLNLWYINANELVLVQKLWIPALAICVLAFASAVVLRDEMFVYVSNAGVTLAAMLIIAALPPEPMARFWEIALPSTTLVILGLVGIHVERAFQDVEGPFGRRRFGLAFFWSGHVQLAAGLLLLLGAIITGDWLYKGVFETFYLKYQQVPSDMVTNKGRLWAMLLVALAIYGHIYSDLVVRKIGVYIYVASGLALWFIVLTIQQLAITIGVVEFIAILSGLGLVCNLLRVSVLKENSYARAVPVLGLLLPLLAVVIGVRVHLGRVGDVDFGAINAWAFVAAMALTVISCRFGAFVYRESKGLGALYFFATGAASLVGLAAILLAVQISAYYRGPILMLLPIAYMIAGHVYHGEKAEHPLVWVAHVATIVLVCFLVGSIGTVRPETDAQGEMARLNLIAFAVLVAVFYALAALLRHQVAGVHLSAMATAFAVWQAFEYMNWTGEIACMVFAIAGFLMLLCYRLALLDSKGDAVSRAAFQAGNTLLSLSFVANALIIVTRLLNELRVDTNFIILSTGLTILSLVVVMLMTERNWRRWYVVTTIGQAFLTFLCVTVLSDLHPLQKAQIFFTGVGALILIASHVGWYREQERASDLVSLGLFLGSLSFGLPFAIACIVDRSNGALVWYNETGFFFSAVILISVGFMTQAKSTTLVGAFLTALYFVTMLVLVKWSQLSTISLFLIFGGGGLFTIGLILSIFRERLLQLPEAIAKREGVFRVLNWR
jgi:hypothetical protein